MARSRQRPTILIAVTGCAGLALLTVSVTPSQADLPGVTKLKYVEWRAVDAGSANDVWAVGKQGPRRVPTNAASAHFDGSAWTEMTIGGRGSELWDVSVLPGGQAWAVGQTFNREDFPQRIEHFDGTSWTQQQSAVGGGDLLGVSAVSSTDVWAVGTVYGDGPNHPFVEHWDGTAWTRVATPLDGIDWAYFTAVVMRTADDGWALCYVGGPSVLILHWDGTSWTRVHAPPPAAQPYPHDVDAIAANDAWLVGAMALTPAPALTQHWNGKRWINVTGPDNGFNPVLNSVSSLTHTDTWAVGYSQHPTQHQTISVTLTAHWNGSRWRIVRSPNPGHKYGSTLFGVAAVAPDEAWAVGTSMVDRHTNDGLILHWDGQSWSVVS